MARPPRRRPLGDAAAPRRKIKGEMPPPLASSVLYRALAEKRRCAGAPALCPAILFAFNVFLISSDVTGVLGDYRSIIGRLCEH